MEFGRARKGMILLLVLYMDTVTAFWLPHLLTEHSEHIQPLISTHDTTERHRRSPVEVPSGFDVTLRLQERPVTLTLRRIETADVTRLPVHVLRNGVVVGEQLDSDKQEITGFYEDAGRDALIMLQINQGNISNNAFNLFGTFCSKSSTFIIQQSTSDKQDSGLHAVTKVPQETMKRYYDDAIVPGELFYKKSLRKNNRSKRQIKQYYIEVYMVTDFAVYTFWKDQATGTSSERDRTAKANIRTFYSYVLYGVDQRYRGITDQSYTIQVVSPGILILDRAEDSPMTELNKFSSSPKDAVSSDTVLHGFSEWDQQQLSLPNRDHTMLFTGYNVVSGASGGDSAGIAYVESLCSSKSQSLIEDDVSPFTMVTASHELGHSLGSDHDGEQNACSSSSNYIMASVNSVGAEASLIANLWIFSSCSVASFNSYISRLDRNNNNCMTDGPNSAFPAATQDLGKAYSPDDICALAEGDGSFVCRSIQDYSSLCGAMYCNTPGTTQCYTVLTPSGTSCGSERVCSAGHCVYSPGAPRVSDECPLGDRPGYIEDYSSTCADLIKNTPHTCYGSATVRTCCGSCGSIYTGVQGCEYGDKQTWCSTLTRSQCYLNADMCCGFCNRPDIKDTNIPGCEYGDKFDWCSSLSRSQCYSSADNCCGYCNQPGVKDTGKPGCEYGDRFTRCESRFCDTYSEDTLRGCCDTCVYYSSTTTTKIITTKTTTTTTTTTTTPSATTKKIEKTSKTPETTKQTISSTIATQQPLTGSTGSPTTDGATIGVTEAETGSEGVIIGVAVGVSVVIVLVAVAIVMIIYCKRRGKKSERKPSVHSGKSSDNAYDNIGFVKPHSNIPHHPPPRRDNSMSSASQPPPPPRPTDKIILRPPKLNIGSSVNYSNTDGTTEIEGYMTPNDVKASPVISGVHYTAPNKPKFNFQNGNGNLRPSSNHSDSNSDSPRTPRKPKHYRRSNDSNSSDLKSGERNSNNSVKNGAAVDRNIPNAVSGSDNQGRKNPNGQFGSNVSDNQPTGTRPNPDSDLVGSEQDTYNEISEIDAASKTLNNPTNKPVPMVLPKPRPRPSVKPSAETRDDSSINRPKFPLKPKAFNKDATCELGKLTTKDDDVDEKGAKSIKLTNNQSDTTSIVHPKIPMKPKAFNDDFKTKLGQQLPVKGDNLGDLAVVESKEFKPNEVENDRQQGVKQSLKPPLKPPMKPVPRRQKTDNQTARDNQAFVEENAITI